MARSLVLVRSSAHVGGIEHFILDLAEFLTRRGWNVGLIFLYRSPQGVSKTRAEERPIHPAVAMARARGLRAYSIPDRAAWDVRPLLALRALLASISPPPLVHTHDYKSDILVTLTRPRYHIATAHGFTDADARQKFYRHLDTLILHRLPLVITPSSSQARTLERYGIKATRLRVIPPAPNWARLMREARRPLPSPAQYDVDAGPVFSFVGRCSPERQGALLLKAFARVAREGPRVCLWVFGDDTAPNGRALSCGKRFPGERPRDHARASGLWGTGRRARRGKPSPPGLASGRPCAFGTGVRTWPRSSAGVRSW